MKGETYFETSVLVIFNYVYGCEYVNEGTSGGWSGTAPFKWGCRQLAVSFWGQNLGPLEGQYGLLNGE